MAIDNNTVPIQLNNTIFDIEQKQNSQEMLDYAAGKPTINFLFADEFNTVNEQVIQSAIDNLQMDLYWQNSPEMIQEAFIKKRIPSSAGVPESIEFTPAKLQLLGVYIKSNDLFDSVKNVTLMIDRYRPKRMLDSDPTIDTRPSGYKHCGEIHLNGKLNEITLTQTNSIIYFGQENHFNVGRLGIKTSGAGYRYQSFNKLKATDFLQFRLKVTINSKEYYSKPLAQLKMTCTNKSKIDKFFTISYKR